MSPAMSTQAQLEYESRVKYRQAAIAVIAGVMLVAAAIIQLGGTHTKSGLDELTLDLLTEHKRYPLDLIGAIVNSIGLLAVAGTLNHVYGITKARNPGMQTFVRWLAVVGACLSAVAAVIYAVVIAQKANQFATHGLQTYPQADALTTGGLIVVLPLIAQFASLLLTGGFVWISLNAMRVGLLTKFMGYLGIFAGVLVLFPIGSPVPVVQGFWLIALAYLFIGRWPSGLPKAWSTGAMEPWPSGADQRAMRAGAGRGNGKVARPEKLKPAKAAVVGRDDDDDDDAGGVPSRTRADTPKRKRKRRR
jgi:hypothetical protein